MLLSFLSFFFFHKDSNYWQIWSQTGAKLKTKLDPTGKCFETSIYRLFIRLVLVWGASANYDANAGLLFFVWYVLFYHFHADRLIQLHTLAFSKWKDRSANHLYIFDCQQISLKSHKQKQIDPRMKFAAKGKSSFLHCVTDIHYCLSETGNTWMRHSAAPGDMFFIIMNSGSMV